MKSRRRNPEGVVVSNGRVVPVKTSYRHALDAFVAPSQVDECSDVAEHNGVLRGLTIESLSPLMVTIRGPTNRCQVPKLASTAPSTDPDTQPSIYGGRTQWQPTERTSI